MRLVEYPPTHPGAPAPLREEDITLARHRPGRDTCGQLPGPASSSEPSGMSESAAAAAQPETQNEVIAAESRAEIVGIHKMRVPASASFDLSCKKRQG